MQPSVLAFGSSIVLEQGHNAVKVAITATNAANLHHGGLTSLIQVSLLLELLPLAMMILTSYGPVVFWLNLCFSFQESFAFHNPASAPMTGLKPASFYVSSVSALLVTVASESKSEFSGNL
jgi:hypothetical protein